MRISRLNLFILFGLLLFSSCRKDIDKSTTTEIEPEVPVYVNCSITGVVYDRQGLPLINVQIDLDNNQAFTDDNGFFYLKDIQANVKGALIRATLSGYTPTKTWVYPQLNSVSFVNITLLKEKFAGEVNALVGGQVNFGDNSSISIPDNALIDQSGALYSGNARVFADWFDPLNSDLSKNELSIQLGRDKTQNFRVLQSFGAAFVQIKGDNDQLLNIRPDKSLTLILDVPDAFQNRGPDLISSWSLSDRSTLWEANSTAQLKGGQYSGEITGLGWVNFATDYDFTTLTVDLRLDDATPISYTNIDIRAKGKAFEMRLRSNMNGRLQAYIPKGESYDIILKDCIHDDIAQKTTMVITDKSNPIEIVFDDRSLLTDINAQLLSCDMRTVKKGYLLMKADPNIYLPVDDKGAIHFTQLICLDEIEIEYQAIDWANEKTGNTHSQKLNTFLNLGNLVACPVGADSSFIIIENVTDRFEGKLATAQLLPYKSDSALLIRADFGLDDSAFQFKLFLEKDYTKGLQEAIGFLYFEKEKDIELTLSNDKIVNDRVNVNIVTKAEVIGDYIEGNFNLEYVENGNNISMEGGFKVKLIH